MIFILAIVLFSAGVSAVDKYYADEAFMAAAECDSGGYSKIFSLNGTDGNQYYYCLRSAPYSSSEEFLVDSYIAFGVELCMTGYETKEISFEVYRTAADRTNGKASAISLCKKRQSRSNEGELKQVGYKPFSVTVCSGLRDSFIDRNGKVFYHCQHWEPGIVSSASGECEDTDGRDVKTADEIESQYGVVLDGDAYGFDPPIQGFTFPSGKTPAEIKQGKNFVNVYKDYCAGTYKLHEYYCDVSTKTEKGFEINCPGGGECSNGECLNPGIGRPDQDDVEGCSDADSGTGNFSVQSYIDFFNGAGTGFRYYDVCADGAGNLFEYFCKNSESSLELKSKYLGEESVSCACSGGVCIGDVTPGESCADEGGCRDGEACRETDDCAAWLFCLDGICTEKYDEENDCDDTDSKGPGFEDDSIFAAGKVTKGKAVVVDRCQDGNLREAICDGSESTEPQDLVARYKFVSCPQDDCKDEGDGGRCGERAEKICERLTFNVDSGDDGNDTCKDKYGEDAWCEGLPEVEGSAGCARAKEVTCSDEAPQDLRADITCCWNPAYEEDEDDRKLGEDEDAPEKSSGLFGSGDFGELMDLLPLLIPLFTAFC